MCVTAQYVPAQHLPSNDLPGAKRMAFAAATDITLYAE
jgi:hypothetical protein